MTLYLTFKTNNIIIHLIPDWDFSVADCIMLIGTIPLNFLDSYMFIITHDPVNLLHSRAFTLFA
jgi:hypothetical protein